jgi:predicted RND superfamily exporter protein
VSEVPGAQPPAWTLWIVQRRWKLLVASLLLVLLAAPGLTRLRFDVSNKSLFIDGDPALVRYEAMQRTFGSDEVIYVLLEVDDPFVEPVRGKLLALGERIEDLPFVVDLRSPFHSAVSYLGPEDEVVSTSYAQALREGKEEGPWKKRVTGYPPFQDVLLSRDARYVGFLARLEPEFMTPEGRRQITHTMQALLREGPWADLRSEVVGTPIMLTLRAGILGRELGRSLLGGLVVAMCVLLLLFRSLRAVLTTMGVVIASLLLSVGIMGLLGTPLSALSGILVTLLICVGIADAVHLISAHERLVRAGVEGERAVAEAIAAVHAPCLFTSLTTAAGFLALLSSKLAPVRNMGAYAAAGCLIAYVMLLALAPALLVGWKPAPRTREGSALLDRFLERVHGLVTTRPGWVAGLALVGLLASCAGIPRVHADRDLMNDLNPDEPLRQQLEFVHERMGGTIACEILLEPIVVPEDGVPPADLLVRAEALEEWLRTCHPKVRAITSISSGLAEMHRLFDGPSKVPTTDPGVAQTMLLLESADTHYCNQHVATDGSSVRITVRFDLISSREHQRVLGAVQEQLDARFGGVAKTHITGAAFLLAKSADYILETQRTSFGLALAIVVLLIAFWTRELRLGLLSVAPNLLPIAFVLGVMGWLGLAITVANALITTIAIGIIVDDTIHITHCLRQELAGLPPSEVDEGIRRALHRAGRAVLFTTLVLAGCFAVYMTSTDRSVRIFGALSALTFVVAFLADVLLLPALVRLWSPRE